jgi:hypothetical protein
MKQMGKATNDMCPGREHMNGPMSHAYENGFCLFCNQAVIAESMDVLEELPEMIRLSDATVALIVEIVSGYVTKEDPDADKATHPIEMTLIDVLVEKRNDYARETGGSHDDS